MESNDINFWVRKTLKISTCWVYSNSEHFNIHIEKSAPSHWAVWLSAASAKITTAESEILQRPIVLFEKFIWAAATETKNIRGQKCFSKKTFQPLRPKVKFRSGQKYYFQLSFRAQRLKIYFSTALILILKITISRYSRKEISGHVRIITLK